MRIRNTGNDIFEGWGQHGEFGGGGEGEEQGLLRARDWNNRFSSRKFQFICFPQFKMQLLLLESRVNANPDPKPIFLRA